MTRPSSAATRCCRWLADDVNSARAALCGARRRETPRIATMTFPGFDENLVRSPPRASTPPRFVASPHASASADARDESTCRFDAAFNRVVFEIQRRLHLVARGPKIRVQFWLRKLHEHVRPRTFASLSPTRAPSPSPSPSPSSTATPTRNRDEPNPNRNRPTRPDPAHRPHLSAQESNPTWKKNRNNHARLLLENLKRGVLEPPFDKNPEDGRVKMLPAHALFPIRGDGAGVGARARGASPGTSPGASPGRARLRRAVDAPSPDAATSLRDLLRRAEVAAGAAASRDGEIIRRAADETRDASVSSPPRPPATTARVGAEMRRWLDGDGGGTVGGFGFESRPDDAGDSAGRVELEAELGAAKERVRELEWRLEKSRKAHERTKAELDETRRGVVVLQKLRADEKAEMRRAHRRELDDLVVSFERRRAEWAPRAAEKLERAGTSPGTKAQTLARPRWSGGGGIGGGIGAGVVRRGADPREKEKDFFEYLEKFQRQTDALRLRAEE